MSSDLYIPPRGIGFRLVGYASQYVIFSRTTAEPQVGHYTASDVAQDQFFELIHGTGKHAGLYAIKGRKSDKVLYSREGPSPDVWHIGGNGSYEDNWFKLEPGKGKYADYFRLVTPSQDMAIYSRLTEKPYFSNHPAGGVYSDQYFTFLFEDMVIDRVDYDLEMGKILSSTPLVLANQTLVNDSDTEQTMTFTLNKTVTHTSSYSYALGFKITLGTKFKAGIPLVAESEITVSVEQSNTFTWGEVDTYTEAYTAAFPVKANPHTIVRAVSTVNQGTLEVPYTIHLSSKSTGVKTETKGVWQGVSTWDLRHTITNLRIGEEEENIE